MARILFIGNYECPDGSPGAIRVGGNARAAQMAGYDVLCCCYYATANAHERQPDGTYLHNGLPYLPLPTVSPSPSRLQRFLIYATGQPFFTWLTHTDLSDVVAIVSFQGSAFFLDRLRRFCAARGVKFIPDCTEWYDPTHVLWGPLGFFRWDTEARLRIVLPRMSHLIVQSSYLQRYFATRGCRSLIVPLLLDTKAIPARLEGGDSGPCVIAYTGTPGKKDLLDPVFESLLSRDPDGRTVRLRMAGPSLAWVLSMPALVKRGLTMLPSCLELVDRLSYMEALDLVRQADFSVLLRPPMRFAQAGFPTKVPESLAVGTPVICNLTSDLGNYIHDGVEGLICEDHSVESFQHALVRALSLTGAERDTMRRAARRQAESAFDYRTFAPALGDYLREIL